MRYDAEFISWCAACLLWFVAMGDPQALPAFLFLAFFLALLVMPVWAIGRYFVQKDSPRDFEEDLHDS